MEAFIYKFKKFFNIGCEQVSDDAIDLLHKYGKIHTVRVQHFGKFAFTIEVETNLNYHVRMSCGGSPAKVEFYDPLSTCWGDHTEAGIKWISANKKIK
jgi:hypothetical protein